MIDVPFLSSREGVEPTMAAFSSTSNETTRTNREDDNKRRCSGSAWVTLGTRTHCVHIPAFFSLSIPLLRINHQVADIQTEGKHVIQAPSGFTALGSGPSPCRTRTTSACRLRSSRSAIHLETGAAAISTPLFNFEKEISYFASALF